MLDEVDYLDFTTSINVMLVDDSKVIRRAYRGIFADVPDLIIGAEAADGLEALSHQRSQVFDVIILDIEMPKMNGMQTLPRLLAFDNDIKILMSSTLTTKNATIAMSAMQTGAADYISKPSTSEHGISKFEFGDQIISKVLTIGRERKANYSLQILKKLRSAEYMQQVVENQRRLRMHHEVKQKLANKIVAVKKPTPLDSKQQDQTQNKEVAARTPPATETPPPAPERQKAFDPNAPAYVKRLQSQQSSANISKLVRKTQLEALETHSKKKTDISDFVADKAPVSVSVTPSYVPGGLININVPNKEQDTQALEAWRTAIGRIESTIVAKQKQVLELEKRIVKPGALRPRIITVCGSTGAPTFLGGLLSRLHKAGFTVLVTQHMPPLFTEILVKELIRRFSIDAVEVAEQMPLTDKRVYVAQGNTHLTVSGSRTKPMLIPSQAPPVNFTRPSVEPMLSSAIDVFGGEVLHIVLSGCGEDGKKGAQLLRQCGGTVIAQEHASAVAWGMPEAALEAGAVSALLHPKEMVEWIQKQFEFVTPTSGTH